MSRIAEEDALKLSDRDIDMLFGCLMDFRQMKRYEIGANSQGSFLQAENFLLSNLELQAGAFEILVPLLRMYLHGRLFLAAQAVVALMMDQTALRLDIVRDPLALNLSQIGHAATRSIRVLRLHFFLARMSSVLLSHVGQVRDARLILSHLNQLQLHG